MPQTAPAPGQTLLSGTVKSVRKFVDTYGEQRHATLLATSTPNGGRSLFEVFSGEALARTGEHVSVLCSVSGVPHSYNVGDGDERRRIQTARHYLNVVGMA